MKTRCWKGIWRMPRNTKEAKRNLMEVMINRKNRI